MPSPSRRRKSSSRSTNPRSRRGRKSADQPTEAEPEQLETLEAIDEDEALDELEPIEDDDLDTLDEWDEGAEDDPRATVTHDPVPAAPDAALRICVAVDAKTAKPDIVDAFAGNLRRLVQGRLEAAVKWRPVVVDFVGEAMIPSAAKDAVGQILAGAKAAAGVIRRGYGDERVHEGAIPTVELEFTNVGEDAIRAKFSCADVTDADLGSLLVARVGDLEARVNERRPNIELETTAEVTAEHRNAMRDALVNAGASRVVLHAANTTAVLHDRGLSKMVRVADRAPTGFDVAFELHAPQGDSSADLAAALGLQPADVLARIDQGRVCLAGDTDAAATLIGPLVAAGAKAVAVAEADDSVDLLYPELLEVSAGKSGSILEVSSIADRDAAAVAHALARELPEHTAAIRGQDVVIAWPDGYRVEQASAVACAALDDGTVKLGARSVAFTFGGKDRVPMHPTPVSLSEDGTHCVVHTDAGKPADLQRAVQQCIASPIIRDCRCRDRVVTVELIGDGLASRSLQTFLSELFMRGEATQVVLDDHGDRWTLAPALIEHSEADGVHTLDLPSRGQRDEELLKSDLVRELTHLDLPPQSAVRVDPHGDTELEGLVIHALTDTAATVSLVRADDTDLRVSPPLLSTTTQVDGSIQWNAAPADDLDPPGLAEQAVRELSQLTTADIRGKAITIYWPGATRPFSTAAQLLIDTAIAAAPESVRLENGDGRPRQLHPTVDRTFVRLIGQRDGATPPMSMLAINASDGAEDLPGIQAGLDALPLESLRGRRVLLVFERDGQPVAFGAKHPAVALLHSELAAVAAAVLEHRTVRGFGSAFQVTQSHLDNLANGTLVRDPRGGSQVETDASTTPTAEPADEDETKIPPVE